MGSKMDMLPIFVYGTLLPEQPNAYLWEGTAVSQQPAVLQNGRLYDMGHYPMLIEEGNEAVQGMALAIRPTDYEEVLDALDELEGFDPSNPADCAYVRLHREVTVSNGRTLQAWVYIGQARFVNGRAPIPNGDWATYAATKGNELDDWWQGIDSVAGLH
ncbi:MAG: gamma-glutamylcyclotransferase [Ardenticatenaceae bacterium]|nr:gamma-glutamylcyclotransferase [Anaerolineales bacterium]MCB8921964.1 gamma-glutamylcyclotransferase [Ardenticatenaceae bacterium]MCB8989540.1 gamma-glutamylcyclotransferase [Ardenticatenaceae bacterium]MCB9003083.1 gamma-glutamylcyclotransferase [Ardenticatenaceae bacterium]